MGAMKCDKWKTWGSYVHAGGHGFKMWIYMPFVCVYTFYFRYLELLDIRSNIIYKSEGLLEWIAWPVSTSWLSKSPSEA